MDINNFFSSEVERFIDSARLKNNYSGSTDPPQTKNKSTAQSMYEGLSRTVFESMRGGGLSGGGTVASSEGVADSAGLSASNTNLNLSLQQREEEKWEKEKTEKQKKKIRTRKGTQGEWQGNSPSSWLEGLFGIGKNADDEKYYKKNATGYIPVQSSNLKAVKYDEQTKQLNVQFLSGSEYSYNGVPLNKFNNLLGWSSHGSYFYFNIRGKGAPRPRRPPYKYHKI